MYSSIKINIVALLLFSTLCTAKDAPKTYIPIITDDIMSFVVIDNGEDLYEASFTSNDDVVIVQQSTGLMWVNEPDVSKGKCAKVHKTTYAADFSRAKGFCKSSQFGSFAGFSNWRTPTSAELKKFILATKNMDVNYDAHCKKLLALKNKNANESTDASYTTITTRYSNIRAQDAGNIKPNFGLRCVRTIK